MRIAVVSDVHGNLTALEAVLADLRLTSPDLILHGGDLAEAGASPVEVVDRIRDFGWQGVAGNGEEALSRPETLEEFASQSSAPPSLWAAVREMMAAARALLGEERLGWLRALPRVQIQAPIALVHASPESAWRDSESEAVYAKLGQPIAVYGHIHRSFIRNFPGITIVNSGSVSLSYDRDPRAAYFLLDGSRPTIRRVEYDVEKEIKALSTSGLPHADWIANTLRSASPVMPS